MTVEDATKILAATKSVLKDGYGRDLAAGILNGMATAYDADCLFRTLMIDEKWELNVASEVFTAADIVIDDWDVKKQRR